MKWWLIALLTLIAGGAAVVIGSLAPCRGRAADPGGDSALRNRRDGDQREIDDRRRGYGVEGDQ